MCYTCLKWQDNLWQAAANKLMNGKHWICFPRQGAIWGILHVSLRNQQRPTETDPWTVWLWEVWKQTVCRYCDGMNRGTDDSSPPTHPSPPPILHPSFPTSLPPSLPRHLEPASHDTRGREGVMMKGQGIGERKREGGPQRVRWRRGGRKGENGRRKRWDKEINNTFILMISWSNLAS